MCRNEHEGIETIIWLTFSAGDAALACYELLGILKKMPAREWGVVDLLISTYTYANVVQGEYYMISIIDIVYDRQLEFCCYGHRSNALLVWIIVRIDHGYHVKL